MKNRYLWLLAGTALSFSLLSIGYICTVASAPQPDVSSGQVMAVSPVQSEPAEGESGCIVQTFDGEICIVQEDTILSTGLSDSLLPSPDREALEKGIPVENQEALAALLEDLGS